MSIPRAKTGFGTSKQNHGSRSLTALEALEGLFDPGQVGDVADDPARIPGHREEVSDSIPSSALAANSQVGCATIMCWVAAWMSRKCRWSGERE